MNDDILRCEVPLELTKRALELGVEYIEDALLVLSKNPNPDRLERCYRGTVEADRETVKKALDSFRIYER